MNLTSDVSSRYFDVIKALLERWNRPALGHAVQLVKEEDSRFGLQEVLLKLQEEKIDFVYFGLYTEVFEG